jgi:DNA helicase-2/ATP-dependent DNA helicase PcrA
MSAFRIKVPDLLHDLTPAQTEAVCHGDGPLLILAGAGSGKTRVITRRVAYLLQQGIRPGNILAITFTNKAAGEMRQRVEQLIPGHRVWISTFHSFGVRLLRQYAERFNLDGNFTIYDMEDRARIVKDALAAAGIDETKFSPDRIASAISQAKNHLQTPRYYAEHAHDFFSQTVAKVYHHYEKKLRQANALDFDDLLYLPALALKNLEDFRAELDSRFQYILIDEYQDTNQAQYELVRRLSMNYRNLCVVGDPDQSIYKWRGSDIRNILDFERDFPDARVIALEKNYRSSKAILHAATALIAHNSQRKKKKLFTDNPHGEPVRILSFDNGLDEAEGVVLRIKDAVARGKARYRDHAIFVRINALTRSLESAFVQHGVPFQIVKGLAFFERKENKDVIAYLRLLVNPADTVSFLRVINEPARGIGKVSLDRLLRFAAERELTPMAACGHIHAIPDLRGKAAIAFRDFYRLITDLRTELDQPPHELIRIVLDRSGYRQMLAESPDEDDADRLANIEELITAAKQFHDQYPELGISDFLEQMTLAADVDRWDDTADCVSVMTLHAAKGLEFPVVYMLALEQGLLPHERSLTKTEDLEEERRLCFVGMTRAMKELYLCHSRVREFRGQALYAVPSMFLDELPHEVKIEDYSASRNSGRAAIEDWRSQVNSHAAQAGYATQPRRSLTPDPTARQQTPPTSPLVHGNDSHGSPTELANGQVVQHEKYGIGQVVELSGYGALRKVRIRFASAGEKTFVASKVQLKILQRR